MSTLPSDTTPFEVFTGGRKPDLSHLRVWGCDCYVAIPDEIWGKAGAKRFRAIFVGYKEHRIGWHVRDLKGKYSFSNDIIFHENLSARLASGVPRSVDSAPALDSVSPSSPTVRTLNHPCIQTSMGQVYDNAVALKHSRNEEWRCKHLLKLDGVVRDEMNGGVSHGGVSVDDVVNGGASSSLASCGGVTDLTYGIADLSPYLDAIEFFISFLDSSSFPNPIITNSLLEFEEDSIFSFALLDPFAFKTFTPPFSKPFDLSKPPSSYAEAIAHPDAPVWHSAIDQERNSLAEMGAFEKVELPKGERTISLKWVYDIKTDADGNCIHGKEKAHLVAQGFNQCPGQYDETYTPIAKLASIRILLAWAAVQDLEIFQFDCKTAFLHAKIRHPLYAHPFPGYPITTPGLSLRILVALYGLQQSAYEFYMLIMSLLLECGMVHCEIDHGVFFGEWTSSPNPSIVMPSDGSPLVLYIPLHSV